MEFSLSTPKNRASTYCTSLSLTAQIKCAPITAKKGRGRWDRETKQYLHLPEMALSLCQPRNPFLTQGLEMFPASPSLATSSKQPCWPDFQEEQGPSSPSQVADLDSISPTLLTSCQHWPHWPSTACCSLSHGGLPFSTQLGFKVISTKPASESKLCTLQTSWNIWFDSQGLATRSDNYTVLSTM